MKKRFYQICLVKYSSSNSPVPFCFKFSCMDCQALLALIPRERKRSQKERKRKQKRSPSSQESALRAGDGAVLDSAADILALLPQRDRTHRNRNPRLKITTKGKTSRQSMQQVVNARRFNASGRAIRRDSMIPTEKVGKLKGRGAWKKWQPEAIQRAGFSKNRAGGFAQSAPENKI